MDADMRALEVIADYRCETGENPLWHPRERRLYWTDIPSGRLFRYDPESGRDEQIYSGRPVGGFTFQEDGSLLLFMDRGTVAAWHDGSLTVLISGIPAEDGSRFNDVIADPQGRVFCGTMSSPAARGRLYRLDLDGSIHVVLEGVGCSNGMAFSSDCKTFYYTDSFAREIYRFDYDAREGSLSNQRVFARLPEDEGMPDGCVLDAEDRLWCALWDGGCAVRQEECGSIVERLTLPVPKVTSLCFGGNGLEDLYITTAGGESKDREGPQAGALFRVSSQGKGRQEFFSRITGTHSESVSR